MSLLRELYDHQKSKGSPSTSCQGRVVQKVDNAIHQINHYPADSVVCSNTYPLDGDLSAGQRYPAFEQPGPGLQYCHNLSQSAHICVV